MNEDTPTPSGVTASVYMSTARETSRPTARRQCLNRNERTFSVRPSPRCESSWIESAYYRLHRRWVRSFHTHMPLLTSVEMDPGCMEKSPEESRPRPLSKVADPMTSPHPFKRPQKRRRSISEEIEIPIVMDDLSFDDMGPSLTIQSQEDGLVIAVSDTEKLTEYLHDAFTSFQQINCRTLCKSLIRTIEPKKQVNFPYNGNLKPKGSQKSLYEDGAVPKEADPEETKPRWWPAKEVCPHKEPDHIKKERMSS